MRLRIGMVLAAVVGLTGAAGAQTVTEVILPQYVVNGSTTGTRLQSAFQLTLSGLTPNATYRYTTGGSNVNTITTTTAPGNYFGITPGGADGLIDGHTSSKSLSSNLLANNEFTTTARYSEFVTNASGSYTGWFGLVPTGNAAFNAGNNVFGYVQINNGSGGTSITQSLVTTNTATVLNPNAAGNARPIAGQLPGVSAEQFVSIFDNVAGSGRPLWTSWTENDGILTNFNTWYTTATNSVDQNDTRFGAYVPTTLANGIRRIEVRNFDGTLAAEYTSADGKWVDWVNGGLVDTVNPTYSTTPLFITPVPEPATVGLVAAAVLGVGAVVRRRLRKDHATAGAVAAA